MRRRELIILLAGATLLYAPIGRGQEPGRVYRLGIMAGLLREDAGYVALFDELRRSGFVEGQNLQVVSRFSMRLEEAPEVAAMLVAAGVDAVLTGGAPVTRVVQKATRTIPIVVIADDLVLSGLVSSLAHPGGNTTGVSILATELDGKRLELVTELVPAARHIAALADPANTMPEQLRALQDAARARGIELSIHLGANPEEIAAAIDAAQASGAQALNVLAAPLLDANRRLIMSAPRRSSCLRSINGPISWRRAVLPPTVRAGPRSTGSAPVNSSKSSTEPSPPTFRSNNRTNSSWQSICRRRRRSASSCRHRSSLVPTRSSNETPRIAAPAGRDDRGACPPRATEGDAGNRLPCRYVA
jgi:putative ABC transport system substrate-binding protein